VGQQRRTNYQIWVKTWAQLTHDCRTRLKIFLEALNYSANTDASLEYLKETYARVLQGKEFVDTEDEVTDGEAVTTPVPLLKSRSQVSSKKAK